MTATTSPGPLNVDRSDPLNETLGTRVWIRWQTLVFVAIFIAAVFTRLYGLGDRAMSHDESLHVFYSYNLYMKGDFDHTPLMHGPIMFHVNALMYALFGDNDFTGRLYAALLGIGMVMTPLLFRRWLGKWGTILASLMILISPLLMYYNRYIREDTPAIMASILMAWAAITYISGPPEERRKPRYLYILSAAMLWNLGSKETAFFYIAIFGLFLTMYWLFRIAQSRWGIAARQWFNALMMSILLGAVIAIGMYNILDITPLSAVTSGAQIEGWLQNIDSRSFILWTVGLFIIVIAAMTGTMLWAFRGKFSRVPWREFIMMTAAALLVTLVFIVIEERSHLTREDLGIAQPFDPNAEEQGTQMAGAISWLPILAPWALMFVSTGIFVVSRRKNAEGKDWWDWLNQFPELDVLWIMGTLVLPWITAIFIVAARGSPEEYARLGTSFGFLGGVLPTGSDAAAIGQFMVGFLCWLPLMITSIAAGVTWNWRRFLVCWLIFHGIFAFFFTTVFTNIQGFATGMIYSLQYWLEQQAERRGSQPQYYYTLIVLPMYEFLPIIGAAAAALGGNYLFWRRRGRVLELEAEASSNRKQKNLLISQAAFVEATGETALEGQEPSGTQAVYEEPAAVALPGNIADIDTRSEQIHRDLAKLNTLSEVPFLLLVSFWAVLNIIVFTLAGEKMPWLGTHMTLPMILLTGWFFGRIFDKVDFSIVRKIGWVNLLLFPLGLAALFQLLAFQFTGQGPFQGVDQMQLQWTYAWLAAAGVLIAVSVGLTYLRRITGAKHGRQMFAVAVFTVLGFVTFRSAWMASFINYDMPNEFLVYAHATSGTKVMLNMLEEISRRTTDGTRIKFAYDFKLSWPGAWYFRNYPNAVYMGETPSLPVMEDAVVVLVGDENRGVVEPLLEDRYQRFDFKRMWWPMQDYFNLTSTRVIDLFELEDDSNQPGDYPSAKMRHGLWDIFWQRDYTKFGEAISRTFTFDKWPVSENMYMYVRKDFAVQVWSFGIGDGSVTNPIAQTEVSACVANWLQPSASVVFDTSALDGKLTTPIGLDVTTDGRVFVAEDQGFRISEFTTGGAYVRSFGQRGPADLSGTYFERPHSVEVASDGSIVVVDTWNYRIRVFNPALEQIAIWGQGITIGNDAPVEPVDGFWGPRDVAIGPDNLVYVADTGNKRIRVYSLQGEWVRDIGGGGIADGKLNEPTGIVVHSDGRLFVADTWNRRVSVFAADGTWLANYPVRAWYDEFGNRPYLALDESRNMLYITDPDGGRILVYSTNGECLGAFGRLNRDNPGDSEFTTIGGIDVDPEGSVYVVDQGTGRILKFAPFPLPMLGEIDGEQPPGMPIPLEIPPESSSEPQG
ncbi:MAG: TIGR03663 family protein [Chloroflexi bacterium]|nr:TIGR03663 family protein [Chloroflexota bacterium]